MKLLAPNGKPSNLTAEQYKLVRTPEFKAWFGDWENDPANASKVVDENGEPLVAYHGTDEKFNIFSYSTIDTSSNYYDILGFYFTLLKPKGKSAYGKYVKSCFLNIRKQILVANKMVETNPSWETKPLSKAEILLLIKDKKPLQNDKTKKEIIEILVNTKELNSQLLYIYQQFFSKWEVKNGIELFQKNLTDKLGYDGAYMPHSEYVVAFHPNQIKLADGTNTKFDGSNPDIRFAEGGQVNSKSFMKWFVQWYKPISDKVNIDFSFANHFHPFKEKNAVILDVFEKIDQTIDAKIYLQEIVKKADEYGVVIYLEPKPRYKHFQDNLEKKKKISKDYLVGYYEKFGFELTPNKLFMRREPNNPDIRFAEGGSIKRYKKDIMKKVRKGGITYGRSHAEGGIPVKNASTGDMLEVEGGEGIVNKRSMASGKKVKLNGKEMSLCEAVSQLNQMEGGVQFNCDDVADRQFLEEMALGGELERGTRTEKEHIQVLRDLYAKRITPEQATKRIAKDHLKEDKRYYSKLAKMEGKMAKGGEVGKSYDVPSTEELVEMVTRAKDEAIKYQLKLGTRVVVGRYDGYYVAFKDGDNSDLILSSRPSRRKVIELIQSNPKATEINFVGAIRGADRVGEEMEFLDDFAVTLWKKPIDPEDAIGVTFQYTATIQDPKDKNKEILADESFYLVVDQKDARMYRDRPRDEQYIYLNSYNQKNGQRDSSRMKKSNIEFFEKDGVIKVVEPNYIVKKELLKPIPDYEYKMANGGYAEAVSKWNKKAGVPEGGYLGSVKKTIQENPQLLMLKKGGMITDADGLKGHIVKFYEQGVKNPNFHTISKAYYSDPSYRFKTLSIDFVGGGTEVLSEGQIEAFFKGEQVQMKTYGKYDFYAIQLTPRKMKNGGQTTDCGCGLTYAEGGFVEDNSPLEIGDVVYVIDKAKPRNEWLRGVYVEKSGKEAKIVITDADANQFEKTISFDKLIKLDIAQANPSDFKLFNQEFSKAKDNYFESVSKIGIIEERINRAKMFPDANPENQKKILSDLKNELSKAQKFRTEASGELSDVKNVPSAFYRYDKGGMVTLDKVKSVIEPMVKQRVFDLGYIKLNSKKLGEGFSTIFLQDLSIPVIDRDKWVARYSFEIKDIPNTKIVFEWFAQDNVYLSFSIATRNLQKKSIEWFDVNKILYKLGFYVSADNLDFSITNEGKSKKFNFYFRKNYYNLFKSGSAIADLIEYFKVFALMLIVPIPFEGLEKRDGITINNMREVFANGEIEENKGDSGSGSGGKKSYWRFKTEQELKDEYGSDWRIEIGWAIGGQMDYLLGKRIEDFRLEKGQPKIGRILNTRDAYGISSGIDDNWNIHSLKPFKLVIDEKSGGDSSGDSKVRFKTEQEFIDEFGSNWRPKVFWGSDSEYMDYLFGKYLSPNYTLDFFHPSIDKGVSLDNKQLGIEHPKGDTNYYSINQLMLTDKPIESGSDADAKINKFLELYAEEFLNPKAWKPKSGESEVRGLLNKMVTKQVITKAEWDECVKVTKTTNDLGEKVKDLPADSVLYKVVTPKIYEQVNFLIEKSHNIIKDLDSFESLKYTSDEKTDFPILMMKIWGHEPSLDSSIFE